MKFVKSFSWAKKKKFQEIQKSSTIRYFLVQRLYRVSEQNALKKIRKWFVGHKIKIHSFISRLHKIRQNSKCKIKYWKILIQFQNKLCILYTNLMLFHRNSHLIWDFKWKVKQFFLSWIERLDRYSGRNRALRNCLKWSFYDKISMKILKYSISHVWSKAGWSDKQTKCDISFVSLSINFKAINIKNSDQIPWSENLSKCKLISSDRLLLKNIE